MFSAPSLVSEITRWIKEEQHNSIAEDNSIPLEDPKSPFMQSEESFPPIKEETLRTASRLLNFAVMPSIFPIRTANLVFCLEYVPKHVDNFVKNPRIKIPVENLAFIQQAYQNPINSI